MTDARRQKKLGLQDWHYVFIPLHDVIMEHWYSATIDFVNKKIAVWDSWESTYSKNQDKPLRLQKHVPILLVSLCRIWQIIHMLIESIEGCHVGR